MQVNRPTCRVCNRNPGQLQRTNANGTKYYRRVCGSCRQRKARGQSGPCVQRHPANGHSRLKLNKGWRCETCGFIAEYQAQLDVDHIDGNSMNNNWDNQQVLCANCHRAKTIEEQDHMSPPTPVQRKEHVSYGPPGEGVGR